MIDLNGVLSETQRGGVERWDVNTIRLDMLSCC